jgi:hypothetical protein
MLLSKFQAYLLFVALLVTTVLLYQSIWLFSGKTEAQVMEFGKGSGDYKQVEHVVLVYVVNYKTYRQNYLRSELPFNTTTVRIKYLLFAPSISRMDTLVGNWGLVLSVSAIIFLSLTIIFFSPAVFSNKTYFFFVKRFPFLIKKVDLGPVDAVDELM